jgi:hypothetical protein
MYRLSVNRRKVLISAVASLGLPPFLDVIPAFATNMPTGPLRVAANVPLTGDLAVYGRSIRDGAMMAAR